MKPKKILTRNFKSFSHENFKNNLRQGDWTNTLKLQLSNVNYLLELFFNKINQTLEKHAPYKYLSRRQQKTAGKPCIMKGILTSIKIKNKIYNKPSKLSQPKMLNINKKLTTNNYAIATEFNTFFNTTAGKIDEKLIPTSYQYQTTLNEPNQNTVTLLPTTEDEIKSKIKELKTNKQQVLIAFQLKFIKTTRMN